MTKTRGVPWYRPFSGSPERLFALLLLVLGPGCSSTTEPPPPVTLLVTNGTCSPGPCSPLRIRGFPTEGPRTPGGPWSFDLGGVDAGTACLLLPSADTFRVGNGDAGETTTWIWTTEEPLALGTLEPEATAFQASPSTAAFVPATAPGWTVTLPGGSPVPSAAACR